MKINEIYKRTAETIAYIEMMVKGRPRYESKISHDQQPSTKSCLDRDPSKDKEWQNRQIDLSKVYTHPFDWSRALDQDYLNSFVNARKLEASEVILEEGRRRGSKNTLGQSEKDGSGKERKESASQAFQHSKPVPLNEVEFERVTRIKPIVEVKELEQPKRKSWLRLEFLDYFFNKEKK